jgi:crotonobetainyl-CoA:carnitine CoA-transferase CaiB-like acyl-CoA transferase
VRSLAAGSLPPDVDLPVADLGSSLFAALAIVSTLLARGRSPEGTAVHLDLSMQEVMTHLAATRWSSLLGGSDADLHAGAPGVGLFATGDGRHVAVTAVDDRSWAALCAALEVPDLANRPYETQRARLEHRLELRERLLQIFASLPLDEILRRAGDLPVDAVRQPDEVVADPVLRERGLFRDTGSGLRLDFPALFNERRPSADYDRS